MPVPSFHGPTTTGGGVLQGLQELSNSQNNARAGIPPQMAMKRGISESSRKQGFSHEPMTAPDLPDGKSIRKLTR